MTWEGVILVVLAMVAPIIVYMRRVLVPEPLSREPLSRETGAGAGADHQGQGQQQKALASTLSLESVGGLESPRLLPPLEHTPRQPSPAAPAP